MSPSHDAVLEGHLPIPSAHGQAGVIDALPRVPDPAPHASLEAQLTACLVRNAACVLGDVKPAALFSFRPREAPASARPSRSASRPCCFPRDVRRAAWELSRRLASHGLRVDVLSTQPQRALVLASRTQRIRELLADPDVSAFLVAAGYAVDNEPHLLSCLRHRLRDYDAARARTDDIASAPTCGCPGECASCPRRPQRPWEGTAPYPHEIGVLLGYPLADVRGFIEHRGCGATAVGPWKVYGDIEGARARWERMRTCSCVLCQRWEQGASLEELIA